ncbi:MAG: hypothetical protein KY475_24280 [Planctomycetes bacterium]|nr:hypothetical protein [Planctomycetota bacterium]
MLTRTVLAVVLAGFAAAPAAQADTYSHIDNLALRLQQYARLLDREFAAHYRHTSQYRHLHEDSCEMVRLAGHVHDVAHHHGSLRRLRSDLRQLDELFHHIEDLVAEVEHDARPDYHGHYGGYHSRYGGYGGHIHGDTRHVHRILRATEDTLHHLQDDVEQLAAIDDHRHEIRGPVIRFGRPGFSFWFGR